MPLTGDSYKTLVIVEVGDVDGVIADQVDTLWDLYAGQTDGYARYLYTKRKALDLLMGLVREQVTQTAPNGVSADLTDKLKNLQIMWTNVDREIATVTALALQTAQTSAAPVIGQISAVAPVTPPAGPDGNSPLYRGDLYGGWRW